MRLAREYVLKRRLKKGVLSENYIKKCLARIHQCGEDTISKFFLYLRFHGGVLAVDIDGVLAVENDEPYEERKRTNYNIKNKYKYTILFTSRLTCDLELTKKWLQKNGVKYDALIMNKLPYDLLIDDKAIRI